MRNINKNSVKFIHGGLTITGQSTDEELRKGALALFKEAEYQFTSEEFTMLYNELLKEVRDECQDSKSPNYKVELNTKGQNITGAVYFELPIKSLRDHI